MARKGEGSSKSIAVFLGGSWFVSNAKIGRRFGRIEPTFRSDQRLSVIDYYGFSMSNFFLVF